MRYFILFATLFPLVTFSQNEANIWYFGGNAGLDFNTGAPVPLIDGEMNTREGCASISDANGDLLFYTDGVSIWNRLHEIMATGLLGDYSATQSSIIIPKPGSTNSYYIFTIDAAEDQLVDGLNYSEVDMSLSGGLGNIVSLNTQLLTPTCEKVTAVLHANQTDIWVVTHEWNSDAFYAYLITNSGVNPNPVISHAGNVITGNTLGSSIGAMKASPDGAYLALGSWISMDVQLFNFDNSSGLLSNPITLSSVGDPYGIEFSPSSKLLYISFFGMAEIRQYNLMASDIPLSATVIGEVSASLGALQLAPDGKIYLSIEDRQVLGVINNPEIVGSGCNFIENGLSLAGNTSKLGLPTFIQSYLKNTFSSDILCFGDTTQFTILTSDYDSLLWDFGDSISGVLNFSNESNPQHFYSNSGLYSVSLIIYSDGTSDTSFNHVNIIVPDLTLGGDTIICEEDTLQLAINLPNVSCVWQNAYNSPVYNVTEPGSYWVIVTGNGCSNTISDTINVSYKPLPVVELGNNASLCEGDTLLLDTYIPDATYLWSDSSVNSSFIVIEEGLYDVEVTLNGCIEIDVIYVAFNPIPIVNLGNDKLVCGDTVLYLSSAAQVGGSYVWQDSTTEAAYYVYEEGIYSVEVTVNNCSNSDTISILYNPLPIINLINDTVICQNDTLILDATLANSLYLWQDGSTDSIFSINEAGVYWVEVTTDGCAASDTINIQLQYCDRSVTIPNVFTPDNDEINDKFYIENLPENSNLLIYNRWGQAILEEKNYQNNWDADKVSAGVYYYIITLPDNEKKKGFVQVIK